jgi:predicted nucleic acid-binding protein
MSDRVFVDTNLLVYAYDDSSAAKRATVHRLFHRVFQSGLGVISTQVLQELTVCLRRRVAWPLGLAEIRKVIAELQQEWEVFVNGPEAVLRALELEDRFQISFWDSLILQAAQASFATILYTEDLNLRQTYGSVQVVNPLKV